jgi:hypothetical protein
MKVSIVTHTIHFVMADVIWAVHVDVYISGATPEIGNTIVD